MNFAPPGNDSSAEEEEEGGGTVCERTSLSPGKKWRKKRDKQKIWGKESCYFLFPLFGREKGGKFVDKTPPAEGGGNELLIFLYCYFFYYCAEMEVCYLGNVLNPQNFEKNV